MPGLEAMNSHFAWVSGKVGGEPHPVKWIGDANIAFPFQFLIHYAVSLPPDEIGLSLADLMKRYPSPVKVEEDRPW